MSVKSQVPSQFNVSEAMKRYMPAIKKSNKKNKVDKKLSISNNFLLADQGNNELSIRQ